MLAVYHGSRAVSATGHQAAAPLAPGAPRWARNVTAAWHRFSIGTQTAALDRTTLASNSFQKFCIPKKQSIVNCTVYNGRLLCNTSITRAGITSHGACPVSRPGTPNGAGHVGRTLLSLRGATRAFAVLGARPSARLLTTRAASGHAFRPWRPIGPTGRDLTLTSFAFGHGAATLAISVSKSDLMLGALFCLLCDRKIDMQIDNGCPAGADKFSLAMEPKKEGKVTMKKSFLDEKNQNSLPIRIKQSILCTANSTLWNPSKKTSKARACCKISPLDFTEGGVIIDDWSFCMDNPRDMLIFHNVAHNVARIIALNSD
uniref:Uncharacterized protein n=1 Tax=Romanomermis culicivorax TaxID=13658 RepID=A0A915L423_ROMCU